MVKKTHTSDTDTSSDSPKAAGAVGRFEQKDSAQQLAGLALCQSARRRCRRWFWIKEDLSIQRKTQAVAEEKITEATARMASM